MKPFLSKYIFWVLQCLGWGGLGFFVILVNKLAKNTTGLLISVFGFTLVGVLMTSVMRWFLKRYVNLNDFKVKDFLKLSLIVVLTIILFPHVSYWFGYGFGKLIRLFVNDRAELFNESTNSYSLTDIKKYIAYFFIVGGWTVFYFVIKVLRRSNNKRLERLELRKKVKQAQLNTLKGHINPQFIFNTMTNIKGLMLEDITASRAMLTKLSEMLRYSLTNNSVNMVLLEEELEMVRNYVSLMQIQYGERFKIAYRIPDEALKVEIPPMLLHNLVEHASKNGILLQKEGGEINLEVQIKERMFHISIEHSGRSAGARENDFTKRTIEQRLRLMYDQRVDFQEKMESEKTTYLVQLPIQTIESSTLQPSLNT